MTLRRLPVVFACLAAPLFSAPGHAAPAVATDLPVTQSLVASVMGGAGQAKALLAAGDDPHHVQLRPSQARALAGADLLIWIGAPMAPWLTDSAPVTAGAHLELIEVPGTYLIEADAGEGDDAGAHDHAHDHDHDHGHDHGDGADPHAWLDPENARLWLDAIAGRLAAIDPENAGLYAANAAEARARIEAAEARARDILAGAASVPIVASHDAYRYYARAFGLTLAGSVRGASAEEPGLKRVTETVTGAGEAGARCLLSDTDGDALDGRVAEASGLTLIVADPAGMTLEPGPELYADLILGLARRIADCAAE